MIQISVPVVVWKLVQPKFVDLDVLERFQVVVKEIDALRELKQGWDTYDAPALDANTLDYATRVFARIASHAVPRPAIVPTVNGGIQFEWHTPKADVEIEVLGPNEVDVHARPRAGANRIAAESVTRDAPEIIQAIELLL